MTTVTTQTLRVTLLIASVVLLIALAGCGGGDESASPTTTPPAETTTEIEPVVDGDATAGEQVFADAGCGGCHTLAAAASTGTTGPDLDTSKPSSELVVDRVTRGMGAMPSFEGELTETQIQDVAAYVVASTSG